MKIRVPMPLAVAIILIVISYVLFTGFQAKSDIAQFWQRFNAVTEVQGACISEDGITKVIPPQLAQAMFNEIQNAQKYSPNNPISIRRRNLIFKTNSGDISIDVSETKNQGILLYLRSVSGWSCGTLRSDDLSIQLLQIDKQTEQEVACDG